MNDTKKRNFNILQDRLSGMAVAAIAEKYQVSNSTVQYVLNRQLSKIAEFDFEFERRLGTLKSGLEDSEKNSQKLTHQIKELDIENRKIKKLLKEKDRDNKRAQIEINGLKHQIESLVEKNLGLLAYKEQIVAKKQRAEYEKIKSSLKRNRN